MAEKEDPPPERVPFEVSHPHLKEFSKFLPVMNAESDRGCVLVSVSYLDGLLRDILLAFFAEGKRSLDLVDGFNAPLGTFSTRTAAARALCLISEKEFKELDTMRRVRNQFAHHVHCSFDDQGVRDLCNNLTMAVPRDANGKPDARGCFTSAAAALILHLTNRSAYVARKRCVSEEWPY